MLAFGTPTKLLDGGRVEEDFFTMLDTGYGRRFIYGVGNLNEAVEEVDIEALYDKLVASVSDSDVSDLRDFFTSLASLDLWNHTATLERAEGIKLLEYKVFCEKTARETFGEHQAIPRAEMEHRYFRVLKLAGIYAFLDGTTTVTMAQLMSAIKLVEESGESFKQIYTRPKNFVRLAKYLARVPEEVTNADIVEHLKFYPTAKNKQEEMLALAIAWGHGNHHIIKRTLRDGIEFFKGESLQEVDRKALRVSHSPHQAFHYQNEVMTWEALQRLCVTEGEYFFLNHHVIDGRRADDNVIAGMDFIVLDCDGEVSLKDFSAFMEGYTFYVYTTKSHTSAENRFRALIPLKYKLNLGKEDYKEFVNNFLGSMPWEVKDTAGNQRSKRWSTHLGGAGSKTGELFDPVPYLPNTKKNEDRVHAEKKLGNLNRVQKFFAKYWASGRNNTLLRYGCMLLDHGMNLHDAIADVTAFNNTFSDPLSEQELAETVFKTMGTKG
jgi:hypothetical protein